MLRQRFAEREAIKGSSGQTITTTIQNASDAQKIAPTSLAITQGKTNTLQVIQPDPTTTSDFDSAYGGGVSSYTRSSRASQSDFEFSESYL